MGKIFIVCKSITSAQKIMNIVTKNGFWANILRTPSEIRLKSCSYSVVFYEKDLQGIINTLKSRNYPILSLYIKNDGFYQKMEGDFE
ncbi:MAG: DUF3343 domain-containing protein [Clostridia bacterium]